MGEHIIRENITTSSPLVRVFLICPGMKREGRSGKGRRGKGRDNDKKGSKISDGRGKGRVGKGNNA